MHIGDYIYDECSFRVYGAQYVKVKQNIFLPSEILTELQNKQVDLVTYLDTDNSEIIGHCFSDGIVNDYLTIDMLKYNKELAEDYYMLDKRVIASDE